MATFKYVSKYSYVLKTVFLIKNKIENFEYFSGGAIWHPRCGPSPDAKIEDDYLDEHKTNGVMDNHVCVELNICTFILTFI